MPSVMQQMLLTPSYPPVTVSYIGSTTVVPTGDIQTIAGVSIGSSAGDRSVFIIVHWQTNPSLSALQSATIGGVAAKIHANAGSPGNANFLGSAIISALVPAGTTATVVLTYVAGASAHQSYLETYRVTGIISDTPDDTISVGLNTVTSYSSTIVVKNDGLLLIGGTMYSGATSYAIGGANRDYDLDIGGGGTQRADGASLVPSVDETARPISVNRVGGSGTAFNGAVVAASFR
jgi:hypothetical protein